MLVRKIINFHLSPHNIHYFPSSTLFHQHIARRISSLSLSTETLLNARTASTTQQQTVNKMNHTHNNNSTGTASDDVNKHSRENTTSSSSSSSSNDNKNSNSNIVARVLPGNSSECIMEAGIFINKGGLVAFPTETVYGLGANALDPVAVLSIFSAKGRPLTDPVIVHVAQKEKALPLLELSGNLTTVFDLLSSTFWPGPLTIVSKASSIVPMLVTANTGFVGVRYPRHEIALSLIRNAGVPIAAPSANRFGHVSPTTAGHVIEDLGRHDIIVLDGGTTACGVGIESTVVKLIDDGENGGVEVLRKGGVSTQALAACLGPPDPCGRSVPCTLDVNPARLLRYNVKITIPARKAQAVANKEGMESPGQLLTHYAPDVPAYILTEVPKGRQSTNSLALSLSECVVVDFGGIYQNDMDKFLAYKDLSTSKLVTEAASALFGVLRWSEGIPGAKAVLLPDLQSQSISILEHSDAVFDRGAAIGGPF